MRLRIDASDTLPVASLEEQLSGEFRLYSVGDCAMSLNIANAISAASLTARTADRPQGCGTHFTVVGIFPIGKIGRRSCVLA